MASKAEMGGDATSRPNACPQCKKCFARLCDLNKHAKSHSRPYKCSVASCKYHEHGWPTAKELERHVNDKHSLSPRTFPCLYQPCPYRSKRESNCKQHMEKAHQWTYVRSKSNGKRFSLQHDSGELDYPSLQPSIQGPKSVNLSHSSVEPASPEYSNGHNEIDFVLFPPDEDAVGDDDNLYGAYEDPELVDSQVYLPWTSPNTRLRKNGLVIEMISQSGVDGHGEPLVDPRLSEQMYPGVPCHEMATPYETPAGPHIKLEAASMPFDMGLFPRKRRCDSLELCEAGGEPSGASSVSPSGSQPSQLSRSSNSRHSQAAWTPAKTPAGRRDGSDEDGVPPRKRPKPSNLGEDFTDTNMPDIFRYAHPQIYDRDQKEKYSPCHTPHRDISTLVRHLSRPAHRFTVTDRIISSFDVVDESFRHPRVGVCRWCWHTFADPEVFSAHIAEPCDKVSKGKREKWLILYHSFTPLVDAESSAQGPRSTSSEAATTWLSHQDGSPSSDDDYYGNPPTSVPSPVLPHPGSATQGQDVVPVNEHLKLQKEHETLREKHQQLEQVTQVLIARQLVQETALRQAGQSHSGLLFPALQTEDWAVKSSAHGTAHVALPSSTNTNTVPKSSDQDKLVQHMDSQNTDVNIEGLMEETLEDAPETLSRQSSGLSNTSSRSTVHHVPTSPPPWTVDTQEGEGLGGAASGVAGDAKALAHRRPPASVPDSAYHSDPRRESVDDVDVTKLFDASEGAGHHNAPQSSDKSMLPIAGGDDISWGNPFGTESQSSQVNQDTFGADYAVTSAANLEEDSDPFLGMVPYDAFPGFYEGVPP